MLDTRDMNGSEKFPVDHLSKNSKKLAHFAQQELKIYSTQTVN